MTMQSIAVCGAGTMGAGIAQIAAYSGFGTVLFDTLPEALARAEAQIGKSLGAAVEKGKLTTDEKENVLQRIKFTTAIEDCVADVIIEAIVEKMAAKTALFNQLAAINSAATDRVMMRERWMLVLLVSTIMNSMKADAMMN